MEYQFTEFPASMVMSRISWELGILSIIAKQHWLEQSQKRLAQHHQSGHLENLRILNIRLNFLNDSPYILSIFQNFYTKFIISTQIDLPYLEILQFTAQSQNMYFSIKCHFDLKRSKRNISSSFFLYKPCIKANTLSGKGIIWGSMDEMKSRLFLLKVTL